MAVEPSGSAPTQFDADDRRQQQRQRLAEHRRLGFDAADAPPEHAEAVDHRRVGVGADERVGVGEAVAVAEHDLGEELQVDLVADALARREHAQRAERVLRPPEERVALLVARVLDRDVPREGIRHARDVDDDRMVDDEVDGDRGIDALGLAAEVDDRVTHRREVDDRRYPGEVLHEDTRRHEVELATPDFRRRAIAIGDAPRCLRP